MVKPYPQAKDCYAAQECDATMMHSITMAGNKKMINHNE